MSVRFDAAADRLKDAVAPISYNNPYTIFFFFYLIGDPGAATAVLWTANRTGSSTYLDWVGVTNSSGIKFALRTVSATGSIVVGTNVISTATWYAVAAVRSSNTSFQLYFMPLSDDAMTADALNTSSIAGRSAALQEEIGGLTTSNVSPLGTPGGRVMGFKSWQAALTPDELAIEARYLRPYRSDNLYRWTPLWPSDALTDYSGNARPWVAAGSLTYESGPPVSWGSPHASVLASYGATFDQDVAGTLEPGGELVRQTNKLFAGALTPAAALIRATAKQIVGALTPAGNLVKTTAKIAAGAIEPDGSIIRQVAKAMAGALTPAGATVKTTAKQFAGALTPAGALIVLRLLFVVLAGAIEPLGDLLRDTVKLLIGSLTPDGALTATSRTYLQFIEGALTPAGYVIRSTTKILTGVLGLAGVVTSSVVSFLRHVRRLVGSANRVDLLGSTRRRQR